LLKPENHAAALVSRTFCTKMRIANDPPRVYGVVMTDWKSQLTEAEAENLAQWEADMQDFKDKAAIYVVWKRRLADKVRARIRKAAFLARSEP